MFSFLVCDCVCVNIPFKKRVSCALSCVLVYKLSLQVDRFSSDKLTRGQQSINVSLTIRYVTINALCVIDIDIRVLEKELNSIGNFVGVEEFPNDVLRLKCFEFALKL